MTPPCSSNPDLWFGYADDDETDGMEKARRYEQSSVEARLICLRRCPLEQQRRCAALALAGGEEYGVWAGLKLPGGQYRKRGELAETREKLRQIAEGEINPRELPENAALLARHEERRDAQSAPVFELRTPARTGGDHRPASGPQTAA